MKKTFEKPVLTVIKFEAKDIIATSDEHYDNEPENEITPEFEDDFGSSVQ